MIDPQRPGGAILVTGANGTIGRSLVPLLAAAGVSVRAACRTGRLLDSTAGPLASVMPVRLDLLDHRDLEAALDGVDRLFLVNPAEILDAEAALLPLIDAASARNLKVVLLTHLGAEHESSQRYRRIERRLQESGCRQVILRPNWFADNFHGIWARDVAQGRLAVPAAEGRISFIDSRDIAAVAASVLSSDHWDGQVLELTGPEALDFHQAARLLSALRGRPVCYAPVESGAFEAGLIANGVPADYARMLGDLFELVRCGKTAVLRSTVLQVTGQPPRPLRVTLRERLSAASEATLRGLPPSTA